MIFNTKAPAPDSELIQDNTFPETSWETLGSLDALTGKLLPLKLKRLDLNENEEMMAEGSETKILNSESNSTAG